MEELPTPDTIDPTDIERGPGGWASFFEFVKTIGFILIAAFVIRNFLVQPFVVDGDSMEPTFHDREYILVDKVSYRLHEPERGDVVVFHPPNRTDNFIKRVIGLPGERVDIQGHQIFIDGEPLEEAYLPEFFRNASDEQTVILSRFLQPNEYFVMGDNRDQSKDSREIGPIAKERIIGRAWVVLYPLQNLSLVDQPSYPALVQDNETQALVWQQGTQPL